MPGGYKGMFRGNTYLGRVQSDKKDKEKGVIYRLERLYEQAKDIASGTGEAISEYETKKSDMLKRISRYNSGMKPGKHQIATGKKPSESVQPNKEDFLNMEVKIPQFRDTADGEEQFFEGESTTSVSPSLSE